MEVPDRPSAPVPRWVVEDYEGAEEDLSKWLYECVFYSTWGDDPPNDDEGKLRSIAEARAKSIERTMDLSSLSDRAAIWQIYKARADEIQRYLGDEYDTFDEYLEYLFDKRDGDAPVGGSFYHFKFLIDVLLPALEKRGIPTERLMSLKKRWSKLQDAIPYIREILDSEKSDTQVADELNAIFDLVADQSTVREFRGTMRERRKKTVVPGVDGQVYITKTGYVMVIAVATPLQRTAVESALSSVVKNWTMGDLYEFAREILGMRREDNGRRDSES